MTLEELSISGAYLATHKVFPDYRGLFREWFKSEEIRMIDCTFSVEQANYSKSKKWVIRGIHYSLSPRGQAKVVTCASGSVVDVLVDLRIGSPTFLKVEYINLAEDSGEVVFIPSGVGHGFIVNSSFASLVYLTSSKYSPEYEKAICPTDPNLGISWPIPIGKKPIISKQDLEAQEFASAYQMGFLPMFSS